MPLCTILSKVNVSTKNSNETTTLVFAIAHSDHVFIVPEITFYIAVDRRQTIDLSVQALEMSQHTNSSLSILRLYFYFCVINLHHNQNFQLFDPILAG